MVVKPQVQCIVFLLWVLVRMVPCHVLLLFPSRACKQDKSTPSFSELQTSHVFIGCRQQLRIILLHVQGESFEYDVVCLSLSITCAVSSSLQFNSGDKFIVISLHLVG